MARAVHDGLVTYTYDLNLNDFTEKKYPSLFLSLSSGGQPSRGGSARGWACGRRDRRRLASSAEVDGRTSRMCGGPVALWAAVLLSDDGGGSDGDTLAPAVPARRSCSGAHGPARFDDNAPADPRDTPLSRPWRPSAPL